MSTCKVAIWKCDSGWLKMKGDRFKAGIGWGVDPDGDPSVA